MPKRLGEFPTPERRSASVRPKNCLLFVVRHDLEAFEEQRRLQFDLEKKTSNAWIPATGVVEFLYRVFFVYELFGGEKTKHMEFGTDSNPTPKPRLAPG